MSTRYPTGKEERGEGEADGDIVLEPVYIIIIFGPDSSKL